MQEISRSVVKKDHAEKAGGYARYVSDFPCDGILYGRLLRSDRAHARIIAIKLPLLPTGYLTVDKNDVPGVNRVQIVLDDMPVFARDTVEYVGDPILMLVGPDEAEVARLLAQIKVEYEDLPPMLQLDQATEALFDYHYGKGDTDTAFAMADKVYEEEFTTGYQEQAYLETQGMIAEPHDGRITVRGSMQCPYYVLNAVTKTLGYTREQVQIVQTVTGGAFGGKEAYPSIVACQTACAAVKAGRPVRLVFDSHEDMEFTSKRHPSLCRYRAAVKNGRVTALEADIRFNAGAYTTLSQVVLQRGIICASGVYNIPNLKVRGRAMKTNTVPSGAFRGFGAPQTFFAMEMMMEHIAANLQRDGLEFKREHLVRQGDETSTGGRYHFPVSLPRMIEKLDEAVCLREKHALYQQPQNGRFRRGIGSAMVFHGAGFTGSAERDLIKAVVRLHKYTDGTVRILVSNTDIGQGVKTTFAKIVAHELNLPLSQILIDNPDTDRVPDSGPTVASRSLMTSGELLRRAAIKLRAEWRDGEEQEVEEHYLHPDYLVPFDLKSFSGDAYPTYAWGVYAVELEVDTLTGVSRVVNVSGCFDVGTPADWNIVIGQMEGGLLQGIGYASMEQMAADSRGCIRNHSFSDYIIPTSLDVPQLKVLLCEEPYPGGPYGGKGAGELPLVGVAPAYAAALEQATGCRFNHIPLSAEDVLQALAMQKEVAADD